MPARALDLERHLDDLRTGSRDGRTRWDDKVALFAEEVARLDPYARQALMELSRDWLASTGDVVREDLAEDPEGHLVARWVLTWPDQREAGVGAVRVLARYEPGSLHPHLGATRARDWPMAVYSNDDAARQLPLLRLLAESELHQRVLEADWQIVTGYRRRHTAGHAPGTARTAAFR